MIRVLHVVCDLSPGGAERLVLELCRRKAPDIETRVATVQGLGPLEPLFREVGTALVEGGRVRRSLGVEAVRRLAAAMRDVDVVHTHLFAGDTWGRLAAILAGVPVVVTTEHNVNHDETWQVGVKRRLAGASDAVVAVSDAVAAYARDVEGIPGLRVIENGIDLSRFGPHRGGDGRRVLAIGRRVPQKGFDVLVRALPPELTLEIAGDGPWTTDHARTRLLGRREDVPDLLAAADILAVPSRWEGFGLAAAEGLAAGIAVVASDVHGLSEVVGDAGLLVPPEDPAALRSALRTLAARPALRRSLGERGRARAAERFDLARMVARYEALYRELVAGGGRSRADRLRRVLAPAAV